MKLQFEKSEYNLSNNVLYLTTRKMQISLLILIWTAMVITSIVNFAKPWYEQFVGKYATTINIALSFILGVCGAFAVAPYLEIQLSTWALIMAWLALGTWATIFYDIWKLVQNWGSKKHTEYIILPEEEIEEWKE